MGPEFYDHAAKHVDKERDDLMLIGMTDYQGEPSHQVAIVMKNTADVDVTVLSADMNPNNQELSEFSFSLSKGEEPQASDVHSGEDTSETEPILHLRAIETLVGTSEITLSGSLDRDEAGEYVGKLVSDFGVFGLHMFIDDPDPQQ